MVECYVFSGDLPVAPFFPSAFDVCVRTNCAQSGVHVDSEVVFGKSSSVQ